MTLTEPAHQPNLPFSIVIPAFNEAAVIERTLRALNIGRNADQPPEVIVVCNGCNDQTANIVRMTYPSTIVIELEEGSKSLAINVGIEAAQYKPVIIVDADVIIEHASLVALAVALRGPEVMAASPAVKVELSGCDRWVRLYYKVWQGHSYLKEGIGGSGVYGLSSLALHQLGPIPPVIADDTYIRSIFPISQQKRIAQDVNGRPVSSTIFAPRRLRNLVSCESRWRAGDAQLRQLLGTGAVSIKPSSEARLLSRAGSPIGSLFIYYLIKVMGRGAFLLNRVRRQNGLWHRDSSRRDH